MFPVDAQLVIQPTRNTFVRRQIYLPILLFLGVQLLPAQTLDPAYHTYMEINAYLDSLAQVPALQSILGVVQIGQSNTYNLPLKAVKISDNPTMDEDEPAVLFLGQCHAEEILGVEITLGLIDTLIHGFQSGNSHIRNLVLNMEIWIVPTYNPEGLQVVHGYNDNGDWIQDVTYRKNRTDNNGNGIFDFMPGIGYDFDGVDLNRNYGFNWIHGDTLGFGDYDYYRGSAPWSESETRAIRELAISQFFTFSVAYHSARTGVPEIIYYPWEWFETKNPPGYPLVAEIGQELAGRIINEAGDSHYSVTPGKTIRGNAHDWFYSQTGSLSYLIEVGTHNLQPNQPLIHDTVERNLRGCFYLLDRALGYPPESKSQLRGIVRNAMTGSPLEGARVNIWRWNVDHVYVPQEGPMFAPRLTDQFGRYRRVLQPGTYKIAISLPGFVPDTVEGVGASASYPTDLNFDLTPFPEYQIQLHLGTVDGADIDFQVIFKDAGGSDTLTLANGDQTLLRQSPASYITISATGYFPETHHLDLHNGNTHLSVSLQPEIDLFQDGFADLSQWEGTGNWLVTNGWLQSQPGIFYVDNAGESINSQPFSVAGMQRIGVRLFHGFEMEWDLDTLELDVVSTTGAVLLHQVWANQHWEPFSEMFFNSAIDPADSARVRLSLKSDANVDFRGWRIDDIEVVGCPTQFVSVAEQDRGTKQPVIATAAAKILAVEPNPMQQFTTIHFQLPRAELVRIRVYNLLGQEVYRATIAAGGGVNTWRWNGHKPAGESVASGIYLVQFQSDSWRATQKLLKLKPQR